MKKIINRHSVAFAVAILILSLSASVFGQEQACDEGANVFTYKNRHVYLFDKRVKRAETGERVLNNTPTDFQFTFKPKNVRVMKEDKIQMIKGEKIVFVPSLTAANTGDLYAIYYRATEDFNNPININNYILPFLKPVDGGTMQARLRPPTYYYNFKGEVIYSSPDAAAISAWRKDVRVDKLSNLEFDTSNLDLGFYWFTLQGMSVVNPTQNPDRCAKTTPPVLIEIVPPPTKNIPPTVKITPEPIGSCKPPKVTIVVKDRDNLDRTRFSPQTLKMEWEIRDGNNEKVSDSNGLITLGTGGAEYTFEIPTNNLIAGTYTVKVKANDGMDEGNDDDNVSRAEDKIDRNCSGAGIVYFQFDEPYQRKDGSIKYNPANYTNPESWVAYNPNQRRKDVQCTINKNGSLYPEFEFAPFYQQFGINPTPARRDNVDKLDEIVNILLLPQNEDLNIYLAGYADWQNDKNHNEPLAGRRLEVVINYLMSKGISRGRIKWDIVRNLWDSVAQSCYPTACEEGRRHDRRVELIYFLGDRPEKIPTYDSTCPRNTSMIDIDEIEWETGE